MNLQKMMQQAQAMQSKIMDAQKKLEEEETEGSSGGGMVKVTLTGKRVCKKLSIDAKLVDPNDKEMLEDLVIAAFNDAVNKIETRFGEEMGKASSGMGLPPGIKLPF